MNGSDKGPSERDLKQAVVRQSGIRHFWVGVFVLLGLISFVVVLFQLTDPATMRGRYMVVTTMNDAGGVRKGDPIQMRGVNIGRVNKFEMSADGRVHIRMEIEGEWGIPVGSRVALAEAGVFGGRTVEILPSTGTSMVAAFDTIPGNDNGGGLLESAGELADQAGDVMTRIQDFMNAETIGSMQGTAREAEGLARELRVVLADQRGALEELTASLLSASQGLETMTEAGPDVKVAASEASALMTELRATTSRLDGVISSLDTVLGRMARGEGTLGLLSRDESLYRNISAATLSLDSLLVDIKANPGRYLKVEIF